MPTNGNHERLARVQFKFEPVARVLDSLAKDIEEQYGRAARLEQRGAMEATAQNAYTVRYSLSHPDEVRLSLTFIVVGEDADLLLLQGHEYCGPRDIRTNPGQVEQRVYRLEKIDEIKEAVQARIVAYLQTRKAWAA